MSQDLRLQVILQTIDKSTAILKKIDGSSSAAAKSLRETRQRLKELDAQQKNIGRFRELRTGLDETSTKLDAAKARVRQLARELNASGPPTQKMIGQLKQAKVAASVLGQQFQDQQGKVQALRDKLSAAGISTANLVDHERRLRTEVKATSEALQAQNRKLEAQAAQHKRLAELKAAHAKQMLHVGMMAGAGVAGLGAGRAMAQPLNSLVNAFAPSEDAGIGLKAAMMGKDGKVPAQFQAISDLATSLGNDLPGTTAELKDMMTTLVQQGVPVQNILNGTGESAAYLAVELKKPFDAAAEFAAKMQDATKTPAKDMMALMDIIQRTKNLGVDDGNMLQGFSKMSPILGLLRQRGLEAAQTLAPLLTMMDQNGMSGESAGNAIRKVFQAGVDAKKVGKGNDLLNGTGISLKFTDKDGNFAGLDNVFAQLEKLKTIQSDEKRGAVIKAIFGDDAETLQVLNTMMENGKAGYNEFIAKMQAQADLRMKVAERQKSLSQAMEKAGGSFTNMKDAIGETASEDFKSVLRYLGETFESITAWTRENPVLVGSLVKLLAILAVVATVLGGLAIAAASILGPIFLMRFGLGMLGAKGITLASTLGIVSTVLRGLATGLLWVGRLMLANPIGLVLTGIALAAALVYTYWEPLSKLGSQAYKWGADMISGLVNGISSSMSWLKSSVVGVADNVAAWFKDKLGIRSPSRVFIEAGANIAEGAALGIAGGNGRIRAATLGLATAAITSAPLGANAAPAGPASRAPIEMHIHALPGMDERALARFVVAEMDRREASQKARSRSSLADID